MKKYLHTFFLIFISSSVFSQKAGKIEIQEVLINFISQNNKALLNQTYELIPILSEEKTDTLALVFNYPNSFVVISTRKEFTPIKAFSFENRFTSEKNENNITLSELLVLDYKLMKNKIKSFPKVENNSKWNDLLQGNTKSTKATNCGPLLKSLYGQSNCVDQNSQKINVTNIYTPNNWSVGCVALTFATVMQYFEWPVHGKGNYSYSDGGSGQTISANFEDTYYQWDNMLDEYYNFASTTEQRKTLGEIAFHAAVPIDMYFTSSGSSSNINKIARAGIQHFRYTSHHESASHPYFWQYVEQNILDSLPIQFSIYTTSGAGHAVVCDGIRDDNYCHLNMGWWGSSNAWYNIEGDFNAGGYSIITGGVFDMLPVPELMEPSIVSDKNTTQINWEYTNKFNKDTFELQVKRDDFDWVTLSDSISENFYTIYINDYSDYKYRVRAKYRGKWTIESWSEEKQLDKTISSVNRIDNLNNNIKIYPQPAIDELTIEMNLPNTNKQISILTLNGSKIFNTFVEENESKLKLNIGNLNKGMYLLKIQTDKALFTKKIILQ